MARRIVRDVAATCGRGSPSFVCFIALCGVFGRFLRSVSRSILPGRTAKFGSDGV